MITANKIGILMLVLLLAACGGTNNWTGPQGQAGKDGKDGSSCSVTQIPPNSVLPNGGAAISCQDRSTSLVANGTNGVNGATGTPGTLIQSVQLCPGTPTYPSTFPEVAFCIAGDLYAVYSIPNAFMTLLTPGAYSSNGINSSCTFTITENCGISH